MKDPGNAQTTSVHPLVRAHPETERLYIGGHVQHFDGMTDEENEPLIDCLKHHSTRLEFTCRFRWESGSLAFRNKCSATSRSGMRTAVARSSGHGARAT